MSDGGDRRIFPPPRRKPGVATVLLRWWAELLLAAGGFALGRWLGGEGLLILALVLAALLVLVPALRTVAGGLVWTIVVPHRVRSGLVQSGVVDRDGRLPWLVWARPVGDGVLVSVVLRAGTTINDVRDAVPLIVSACGAAGVELIESPERPDRLALAVQRPRWGLPPARRSRSGSGRPRDRS